MLQFQKIQLLGDPKMDKKMELQKLKWQTCQEIKLQKAYRTLQKSLTVDKGPMTIHRLLLLLLLLLEIIIIMRNVVKKSEHNFEHQKCPTGGTLVPTDSENFDVCNSLGSIHEIPNYMSLHESIKKCIQKNSDVFCSKLTSLRHIKTDPITISIRGGRYQKPKPCYRARPIPAHWYTKGRSILADLEEQGLIVCVTEASEYCSPCFFIAKPHDPSQPRLVVDYSLLNDIILRPVFPLASPEMVWRRIPKGKGRWWISNDLTSSYWQVRISEESQGITTFISEFGRYKWSVFPQGLSCSGDEFGQRLEIILSNYPKFRNFPQSGG